MDTDLVQLLEALLILLPVAAGLRIIHCLMTINANPDQAATYKNRIKNILFFVAISETAVSILKIVYDYLRGR